MKCDGCKYSWEVMGEELRKRDGGHCYMFKDKPAKECVQGGDLPRFVEGLKEHFTRPPRRSAKQKPVRNRMVKVVEVRQGTCSNITQFNMNHLAFTVGDVPMEEGEKKEMEELLELEGVTRYTIKTVDRATEPPWGCVWYLPGKDLKLKLWKANYDTSD